MGDLDVKTANFRGLDEGVLERTSRTSYRKEPRSRRKEQSMRLRDLLELVPSCSSSTPPDLSRSKSMRVDDNAFGHPSSSRKRTYFGVDLSDTRTKTIHGTVLVPRTRDSQSLHYLRRISIGSFLLVVRPGAPSSFLRISMWLYWTGQTCPFLRPPLVDPLAPVGADSWSRAVGSFASPSARWSRTKFPWRPGAGGRGRDERSKGHR